MKTPSSGTERTVLIVSSVSVSSGTHNQRYDTKAFEVLQDVGGLGHLNYADNRTTAISQKGETILLLEYDTNNPANQKPFRMLRMNSHACIQVETGLTVYIQEDARPASEIEIVLKGNRLIDWKLKCTPADEKTISSYKAMVGRTGITQTVLPASSPSPAPAIPKEPPPRTNEVSGEIVLHIPLEECIHFQKQESDPSFSGQPRKYFDDVELQKLVGSIRKRGQVVPAIVCRIDIIPGVKWEIIAGERRWRSLKIIGFPYLRAIEKKPENKKEQHMLSLIENLHRVDPSSLELSNALQEQINAGETQTSLAEATSLSRVTIAKLLAIQSVHPNLKVLLGPEVAEENRIRLDEAAILGKIHPDHQVGIWNQAKDQPSRRLIVAKLHQLGRSLFQHKRTPRENRRNHPYEVSVRTNCRLNALNLALIELKAVTPEEWHQYATLRGENETSTQITRLTESIRDINEIKNKVSQAKIAARSIAPDANQATG